MPSVEVKNACSCAIKRAIDEQQYFSSADEAAQAAEELLEQMRREFCKKHRFELRNEFGNYVIYILANR